MRGANFYMDCAGCVVKMFFTRIISFSRVAWVINIFVFVIFLTSIKFFYRVPFFYVDEVFCVGPKFFTLVKTFFRWSSFILISEKLLCFYLVYYIASSLLKPSLNSYLLPILILKTNSIYIPPGNIFSAIMNFHFC